MSYIICITISIIFAYLIGSIPTGYIFARILKGIDIREHGSGNVGATNVVRTVGKLPGILVLVIDFLKGFSAVTLIPIILKEIIPGFDRSYLYVYVLLGGAAIVGHIWTCFLNFKGGKGVATTAGVMAGLTPFIFLGSLVVWICVFVLWKYVSLASIAAAISLPILTVISGKDLVVIVFCSILCLGAVYTHRSNIKRLLHGTESKIVKAKKS